MSEIELFDEEDNADLMDIAQLVEENKRLKEQLNDEIQEELKQSEIMVKKQQEIERLHSIIKEAKEEVRIYEEQSKDGITNELDNYVFIQRLKIVLDKENK